MSFTLESLDRVLSAKNRLAPDASLRFVGAVATKHVAALVVSIAASELFDTAVADMLDAIGNAHMKAAIRALHDARDESSEAGKQEFRRDARGQLRSAYDLFEKELRERKKGFFGA